MYGLLHALSGKVCKRCWRRHFSTGCAQDVAHLRMRWHFSRVFSLSTVQQKTNSQHTNYNYHQYLILIHWLPKKPLTFWLSLSVRLFSSFLSSYFPGGHHIRKVIILCSLFPCVRMAEHYLNQDQVFLLRNLHKFLDAVMLTFLKLEELKNLSLMQVYRVHRYSIIKDSRTQRWKQTEEMMR